MLQHFRPAIVPSSLFSRRSRASPIRLVTGIAQLAFSLSGRRFADPAMPTERSSALHA